MRRQWISFNYSFNKCLVYICAMGHALFKAPQVGLWTACTLCSHLAGSTRWGCHMPQPRLFPCRERRACTRWSAQGHPSPFSEMLPSLQLGSDHRFLSLNRTPKSMLAVCRLNVGTDFALEKAKRQKKFFTKIKFLRWKHVFPLPPHLIIFFFFVFFFGGGMHAQHMEVPRLGV